MLILFVQFSIYRMHMEFWHERSRFMFLQVLHIKVLAGLLNIYFIKFYNLWSQ